MPILMPLEWDLAFAPDSRYLNNLFHADARGRAIGEWEPDGTNSILIGNLPSDQTAGLAFGPGGEFGSDLYVAFSPVESIYGDSAIRKVDPDGVMTDFVISDQFGHTNQLAFDTTGNFHNNLLVSDWEKDTIFEATPDGFVSIFATDFLSRSHLTINQMAATWCSDPMAHFT